jgi:hypothetical protein
MADYLAGLAARALGVEMVVRPRPAARFEPQAPEEPESLPVAGAPELDLKGRAAEPAAPTVRADPIPPDKPLHAREPAGEEAGHAAAVVSPAPAESRVKQREQELVRPSSVASTTHTAPRDRREREVARPERIVERPATTVRPASRLTAARRAMPAKQIRDEPPPVRVTIGRIEVRAVVPPPQAAPRPAPRRPAPLSLDEYLEQRRSGRR